MPLFASAHRTYKTPALVPSAGSTTAPLHSAPDRRRLGWPQRRQRDESIVHFQLRAKRCRRENGKKTREAFLKFLDEATPERKPEVRAWQDNWEAWGVEARWDPYISMECAMGSALHGAFSSQVKLPHRKISGLVLLKREETSSAINRMAPRSTHTR